MRIGGLAAQASLSTKAIRYDEQLGILPAPARTRRPTATTTPAPWDGWPSSALPGRSA